MADMTPGQVIAPHGPEEPQNPSTQAPAPNILPEQPTQQDTSNATAASERVPLAQTVPDQLPPSTGPTEGDWFRHEADPTQAVQPQNMSDGIAWNALEFVTHEKSRNWYVALAAIAVVAPVITYLAFKDKFSAGVIFLVVVMFGIVAGRKPKTQQYGVSHQGVRVGDRLYGFEDYKTFSVAEESGVASIIFMPMKRFMPARTIYLAPGIEDQVVDFLAAFLPFAQHKDDAVDSLLRRIRF